MRTRTSLIVLAAAALLRVQDPKPLPTPPQGQEPTPAKTEAPAEGTKPADEAKPDDPWAHVPKSRPHLDHSGFFDAPFEDGPAVTQACLECHEDEAHAFMRTSHWTWHGRIPRRPGLSQALRCADGGYVGHLVRPDRFDGFLFVLPAVYYLFRVLEPWTAL